MKILENKKAVVIVSGREVNVVVYEEKPDMFYVLCSNRGLSGPFAFTDNRFKMLP